MKAVFLLAVALGIAATCAEALPPIHGGAFGVGRGVGFRDGFLADGKKKGAFPVDGKKKDGLGLGRGFGLAKKKDGLGLGRGFGLAKKKEGLGLGKKKFIRRDEIEDGADDMEVAEYDGEDEIEVAGAEKAFNAANKNNAAKKNAKNTNALKNNAAANINFKATNANQANKQNFNNVQLNANAKNNKAAKNVKNNNAAKKNQALKKNQKQALPFKKFGGKNGIVKRQEVEVAAAADVWEDEDVESAVEEI
ncbi:hypothetical protein HK104_011273 [Borealophlyctis nickersoniae]|nr:hypothetical protein HK104_011273 [Borealophlyctis nickersoniae]